MLFPHRCPCVVLSTAWSRVLFKEVFTCGSGLAVPCPDNLSMAPWCLAFKTYKRAWGNWAHCRVSSVQFTGHSDCTSPTPGLTIPGLSVMEKKLGLAPFLTCTFRYTVRKKINKPSSGCFSPNSEQNTFPHCNTCTFLSLSTRRGWSINQLKSTEVLAFFRC